MTETSEPKLIQGKQAGSVEEWRVSIALEKLKLPYVYQLPLFGGFRLRGGMVVDFVVQTPFAVPVEVFGEYWHRGELKSKDNLRLIILRAYFHREPVVLWGSELQTQEAADQAVRRALL